MPVLRNPRHEAFAQGLAKGLTADAAYREAGYKSNRKNAARMKTYEDIRERVLELSRAALPEIEATVERVLAEMMRMAFYNPVDVIRVLGPRLTDLKALEKLPEDLQRCIHKIVPTKLGDDVYYRVEFADKAHALDQLARHLQMFKDTVIVENVFKIVQEMSDEELDRRLAELGDAIRDATGLDFSSGKGPKTIH